MVGARGGAVDGVPHGGDVVAGLHLVGEGQQPVELGRHHMGVRAPVYVDDPQHLLGRPLVHQHQPVADVQGRARELEDRGVVERRADEVHVAVERPDAEDGEEAAEIRLLGELAGQRAPDTAGAAGGARGVVHDPAEGTVGGHGTGLSVEEFGVRAETLDGADRVPLRRSELRLVGGVPGGVGEAFVGDQDLGPGVGDDPGDLGSDEVVVDGDEVEARLRGCEVGDEELDAVGQDDGEGVAAFEAGGAQSVDEAVGRLVQPPGGPLLAGGGDQDDALGVGAAWAQKPLGDVVMPLLPCPRCG